MEKRNPKILKGNKYCTSSNIKRKMRPYSFSYFHLANIYSTIIGIILIILYLISILEDSSTIFNHDHDHPHDVIVPVVLLAVQIGLTCYNIRQQSISNRPIILYYIFFNVFMTELSHRLLKINDMYFLILLQGINDFYTLQIIRQTWLRSLLLFSTGGYFMLRKLEIPSVFGFISWFLVSLSFYAQEFNIQRLVNSFQTDYDSSNKELKQIKRALQSIPDSVAIIYDDIICYSNYSMQKNLFTKDSNDLMEAFQEILINPEESNFHFEHRNLDNPPVTSPVTKIINPLFMSDKNSERSNKDQIIANSNSGEIGTDKALLARDVGSKVIDINLNIKSNETNFKDIEKKFANQFKDIGIKNFRYILGLIQSKEDILGTDTDDRGSTVVFTNCLYQRKKQVYDIKVKKVTWNKNRTALLIIFVDKTIQNNAELLMRANKFKEAVLSYVSHEIKTPLNAMLVNLENLKDIVQDKNLIENIIIPSINSGCLLQSTLIDIDMISKIEKQEFNPKITDFTLREFLIEITGLFHIQIIEKNINVDLQIYPLVPLRVRLCKDVLKQLLVNLISNSVKYTFKGFIKISVTLDPNDTECLIFNISDSGVGIKDEDMDKIGQVFYKQAEKRRNFQNTGIGLGLHICRNLIQFLHTESLKFTSSFGHGTSVTFKAKLQPRDLTIIKFNSKLSRQPSKTIPFTETSEGLNDFFEEKSENDVNKPQIFIIHKSSDIFESKPKTREIEYQERRSDQSLSTISTKEQTNIKKEKLSFELLVVDDNQFSVIALKNMLMRSGIKIESAANGEIAIEKMTSCDTSQVKLIIMDLNMPIMDGIECTKKLKAMMMENILPDIPIVMSSAVEEIQSMETAALFVDSLPKPVERGALLEIVNHYISKVG